jgi:hypothetical protein
LQFWRLKSNVKTTADFVLLRDDTDDIFALCPQVVEGEGVRQLSGTSFIRLLIPFVRVYLAELIASQRLTF